MPTTASTIGTVAAAAVRHQGRARLGRRRRACVGGAATGAVGWLVVMSAPPAPADTCGRSASANSGSKRSSGGAGRPTARRSRRRSGPGRPLITSTRVDRYTASDTECVMNSPAKPLQHEQPLQLVCIRSRGDLVERAERLVEQERGRARRPARGRSTPASACRRTAARACCFAKPGQPDQLERLRARAAALGLAAAPRELGEQLDVARGRCATPAGSGPGTRSRAASVATVDRARSVGRSQPGGQPQQRATCRSPTGRRRRRTRRRSDVRSRRSSASVPVGNACRRRPGAGAAVRRRSCWSWSLLSRVGSSAARSDAGVGRRRVPPRQDDAGASRRPASTSPSRPSGTSSEIGAARPARRPPAGRPSTRARAGGDRVRAPRSAAGAPAVISSDGRLERVGAARGVERVPQVVAAGGDGTPASSERAHAR